MICRQGRAASRARPQNPASCSIRDRHRRSPGRGWSIPRRARSSPPRAPAPVFPWLPDRDSCRDPPAGRIKEQRLVETKRYDIPGAEPCFGVGQRHDGLAAKIEMEMALVAEMLDAGDG